MGLLGRYQLEAALQSRTFIVSTRVTGIGRGSADLRCVLGFPVASGCDNRALAIAELDRGRSRA